MKFIPIVYEHQSPQRIVFGWGRRNELPTLAGSLAHTVFLVCSRSLRANGTVDELTAGLAAAGLEVHFAAECTHEPEVADVDRTADFLRKHHAGSNDLLVAVGGGSAIDLAKAAGAMATNCQSPTVLDYLEGVGRGLKITELPVPLLAMPTTGGTGAEATKNAVISSYEPLFKKSLRSEHMVPKVVLVDPELSVGVPPATTAWTGMDAISQLIESYISRRAQPIPQALALSGLKLAAPAVVEAVRDGSCRWAREQMAHAALLSGMALANSGLGLAHGVAAALGVHNRVPHGLACAVMLPVAMRTNRSVREAEMARLGEVLTERNYSSESAAADAAVVAVQDLCDAVGVPRRLSQLGVQREQIPALVQSSHGNSLSGNPRDVSDDELAQLLEDML